MPPAPADQQGNQQADQKPATFSDHAAAYVASDTEVQRLERDRAVKADQLAALDKQIAEVKQKRDASQRAMTGAQA